MTANLRKAFCLSLMVSICPAEDDITKLKSNYEAAVKKAVAPLKTTYQKELKKLLEAYTRKGDLAGAERVMGDIKELEASGAETQGRHLSASLLTKPGR
jgi:hypothetical protein